METKDFSQLTDCLKATDRNYVYLSFGEIAEILGMESLPDDCRKLNWWNNLPSSPQAQAWLGAGFEVRNRELILVRHGVEFWKIEDEKKYKGWKAFFWGNRGKPYKILTAIGLLVGIIAGVFGIWDGLSPSKPENSGPSVTVQSGMHNSPIVHGNDANITYNFEPQPIFIHPDEPVQEYEVAMLYYNQLDYPRAKENLESALEKQISLSGPASLDVAKIRNTLGVLYLDMADYDSAIKSFNHALVPLQREDVQDDIAGVTNNIAIVYYSQGNYDQALAWFQKALAIYEKVLGTDHPSTAATYNNIAIVYANQGNYDQALAWFQKALAIREKVLGTDHPDTATTYNNIANVYYKQGNYDKALAWYRKAYKIRLSKIPTHPDTIQTRERMQYVYELTFNPLPFDDWLKTIE